MLGIRQKLIIGFSLIVIFVLAQAIVTMFYVSNSEDLVSQALNEDFSTSIAISKIAIEGQKLRRYEKEYFIYVDNLTKRAKYVNEWQGAYDKLEDMLFLAVNNKTRIWSQADIAKIQTWQKALRTYGRGFHLIIGQVRTGRIKGTLAANAAIQDAKNKFKVLLKGASKGGAQKFKQARASHAMITDNFEMVNNVLIIGSAAGVLLTIVLLFLIPTSISKPIEVLTRVAREMSTGDLSKPVPAAGAREFKELSETLERMRVSQKTLISRMKARETTSYQKAS